MAYTPPPDGYIDPDPKKPIVVDITGQVQPGPIVPYIPNVDPWVHPFNQPVPDTTGGSISEPAPNQYTISSTILDKVIPMVYGPRRVIGQLAAWDYDGDTDTLIIGVIFCYGEQDSVTDLKINGEDIDDILVSASGYVNDYGTHVGDGTTAIDSLLSGISIDDKTWSPTDTTTWQKYAHAVVSIDTASASAPGSFKIEAVCGGRKIAPVGGGAKTMSTSPVRVAYDVETDADWKGLDSSKIHDTSWSAVNAWCVEAMDDGNPRYEFAGVITDRNPDTVREMVLKHCLAATYIDTDGKRRMWCEMLPGALSGTWTSGGTPTPTEDDMESYATSALPSEWVAAASNVTWTVEDDGSGTNNVLQGDPSANTWGSCYWDDLGTLTDVDLSARVKCPTETNARAGIFARAGSFSSGKPATGIVAFIRRSSTNAYYVHLVYYSGTWEYPLWSAAATDVSDGDWVYLRLYISGSTLKVAWSEAGVPSTWDHERGHTQTSAAGYVGAYFYAPNGNSNGLYDDFSCGIDGSSAASTNDYLIALNGDGAATTELTVGDTVVYKGYSTTVLVITDDDNIQIADEISGYEAFLRKIESLLNIGLEDWVTNPSCNELNINTVPDIIRVAFTDGVNFGSQTTEESYGTGTDKILEMSLPGCIHAETAGRVAKTNLLIQHLQPYTWTGVVSPEIGAQLEPGDVVTFDTDLLTGQMGRVLPPVEAMPDGTYRIALREYDLGAYSDEPGAVDTPLVMASAWASGDTPGILDDYVGVDGALLRNGTVSLTADWDAGGYEIRARTFESDVATGVAPLTIASTTLVNNLNADLLDGNEASAFATDSSVIHKATAGEIAALTSISPAAADSFLVEDASDSNNKKRVTYTNILRFNDVNSRIWMSVKNDTGTTIAGGSLCYISGDSSGVPQITKADADAAASSTGALVMLPADITNGSTGTGILFGIHAGYSGLTPGAIQYVSTTAGEFTETAPSGSGDIVRVAGYAISSSEIFLNPGHTWVEIV